MTQFFSIEYIKSLFRKRFKVGDRIRFETMVGMVACTIDYRIISFEGHFVNCEIIQRTAKHGDHTNVQTAKDLRGKTDRQLKFSTIARDFKRL